ncbi:MAG: hypothetical protein RL133_1250 [Pseudomonadota bacterium]
MTAPKVILIVRLSAMGDLVMASGFAQAIRQSHPQARVFWLVQAGFEPIVEAISGVDHVIVWPRAEWTRLWRSRQWLALWRAIRTFRDELRALQIDWAIDLQGLLKSGLLARLSGAKRQTSLGGKEGSSWLSNDVVSRGTDRVLQRAVMGAEYAELAGHLGFCSPKDVRPALFVPERSQQPLSQFLQSMQLEPGRFVVVAPFTTRPQKHWPEEHWRALLQIWSAQLPLDTLVMLGGPGDSETSRRMAQDFPTVRNLVGSTPLSLSLGVLSAARVVIGVDTGLTHAAQALGVPTVALFGSTIPYHQQLHSQVEILWKGLSCSPCRRHPTCNGRFDCLRLISPLEVFHAATRVSA